MSSGPMPQPMMIPSPYYGMPPIQFQQPQGQQQQKHQQNGPGQQQEQHHHYQQQQQPSYYHYPVTHHYPPNPMMMTTTTATMTMNSSSGGVGGGGFTISHDEVMLLQKLKHQIDWYFSPKNLRNDTYLLNQLNATDHLGAVSVETICNFPKIRELVHTFYATRMGYMVPPGPPPMAPPHLIQTALRLDLPSSSGSTATTPDATRTEIVTLSDDGLWISPTSKEHAVPGQNRQISNATAVTINDFDRSNSNNRSGISSNGHNNNNSNNSNSKAKDEPQPSSPSLKMINGNINGKEVSDGNNNNSSNEGGTPTSGGGASVPTMSTGISTAPSSPSSQASSVGVRTYPLPQPQRNVVIVRDIPSEAQVEDVIEALSTLSIKPKSARPDIGNTWYVTFESEEHAVSALAQANDKTVAGAPILGRLKSESLPAAKPGGLSTINKSEGSQNITPTSTGATGNPPPIAMLPPSANGTENDGSVTESVTSSVRSANSRVASHPGTHVVYPAYPPMMQHHQMAGIPPPFTMPPNPGYGLPPGAPHQMYAMHYFPPQQMGIYPGGMPQRYVPQYQYHHQQHSNPRNWHPYNHANSRHHQRQSGSQGSSSRSKQQQQQQQQQNAQKPQQQTHVSTQSVSSATDHSQLDGSQRHASSLTPPEHVFLKTKKRDTIDGLSSTKTPHQARASNISQQHDQLGPRPPTQKKNNKKSGKKSVKNTQVLPTNQKVKSSGRDSDTMSVGSRNSRRSSSSNNNNSKRNTAQSKKKNAGNQSKKVKNNRSSSNDRGKGAKSGQSKKDEPTTGKQTSGNGKQKKESTRPGKKSGSKTVINVSDFPALGGGKTDVGKSGVPKNDASKQGPLTTGYAQALLKARVDGPSKNNTETPASSEA